MLCVVNDFEITPCGTEANSGVCNRKRGLEEKKWNFWFFSAFVFFSSQLLLHTLKKKQKKNKLLCNSTIDTVFMWIFETDAENKMSKDVKVFLLLLGKGQD